MSSLFLGRVSISILSGGNCLHHHFHLTTIGVSDNRSVINSDWSTVCRIAYLLCYGGYDFHRGGPLQGFLRPCSLEGRMGGADCF